MAKSEGTKYRKLQPISIKKMLALVLLIFLFTLYVSAQDVQEYGWTATSTGTASTFYDVAQVSDTTTIMVGANGIIMRTTDSSATWASETSGTTNSLLAVSATPNVAVAVGEQGEVLVNTGNSWVEKNIPAAIQLNGIAITSSTTFYVVGESGAIWITSNGGDTWIGQSSGVTVDLQDIDFFNSTYGIAVGANNTILGTLDGGNVWGVRTTPVESVNHTLYAVDFYSATRIYAVGENGTFLRSSSLTNTIGFAWTHSNTPFTTDLYDLYVASIYKVVVVGANSTVFLTKDGGNLFKPQSYSPSVQGQTFYAISIWEETGVITGTNGIALYTTTLGVLSSEGPSFRNFNDWSVYLNFIKPILIKGFYGTLSIVYFSMILGFSLGILLAILKTTRIAVPIFARKKTVEVETLDPESNEIVVVKERVWNIKEINLFGILATIYTDFFRNTPLLVQFFIIHFGLVEVGIDLTLGGLFERSYLSSIFALGLNSAAYQAEIIRSGILAIPTGQMEAGRSLGLTYVQTMRYIILPQAVRIVIPPLGNEMINLILNSSLAYTIGYFEITRGGRLIISTSFKTFETWAIVLLLYFVITYTMANLLKWYERKSKIPGLGLGEV